MTDNISIKEKMDKALKVRNTTEKDTFLTKMGFKDEDLMSQDHDNILMALMNDSIIDKIVDIRNKTIGRTMSHSIPKTRSKWTLVPEYPVNPSGKFIIGFIDLMAYTERWTADKLCIEIKTRIDSVGALMRQMNTYREYMPGSCFVVVAPNTTEAQKKILLLSGICLIDLNELL